MPESRAAWGIDIGQSALKALKLQYLEEAGQAVAVAFDYVPYPKILSQPDAIPEEIVTQAMQTFLSRNEVGGDLIAISVPGQSALARFIQLPPVETSKLAEIIKYEARQQIPFALDEVIWDYQPLGSGAEESGYLLDAEVGLFAMKRDQVQQALKPFNEAKLEVELIQIAPLTLYNVLTFDELGIRPGQESEGQDEYIIMLDMGCDNTALLVSNGKKIWVRNVPLGGNHFTRALTKEMKLSFAKAEHLKCNATKAPDPRAVFQALRPVFNDYASEIQRSIGFFSSVNRQARISKVIGLGNGFKLAGLQKFLQQNLQYEVERPDTYKALSGDAVLNAPLFSENVLSFAVAYGLALQAVGQTRIRTSLLPPEITTARKIRRKKPWAVAACAVLMLGYAISTLGNAYSYTVPHAKTFEDAKQQAEAVAKDVSTYESNYSSAKSTFESTKAQVLDLVEGRRDLTWLDAYNAVLDCLPRDEGDVQDIDIEKRQLISLTHFTAEKKADVGEWFMRLPDVQKRLMLPADRDQGPTGPGYIISLVGQHWHFTGDPQDEGEAYLKKTLLHNLQQPQVQVPDMPPRDVRRMGITHPTIVEAGFSEQLYDPLGVLQRQQSPYGGGTYGPGFGAVGADAIPLAGAEMRVGPLGSPRGGITLPGRQGIGRPIGRGGRPNFGGRRNADDGGLLRGGAFPRGGRGSIFGGSPLDPGLREEQLPENVKIVKQMDFVIQFVFQPKPKDERNEATEGGAAEGGAAEGGTPETDSSAGNAATTTPAGGTTP